MVIKFKIITKTVPLVSQLNRLPAISKIVTLVSVHALREERGFLSLPFMLNLQVSVSKVVLDPPSLLLCDLLSVIR